MLDHRQSGVVVGEEQIKLLTLLVDIFEPLSRVRDREHQLEAPQHQYRAGRGFLHADRSLRDALRAPEGPDTDLQVHPRGGEFTIAVVESGTVVGDMVLTGQRPRNAYAQAMEQSEVSAMCRADVERLILDKPQVGLQLVYLLSDRLSTYETRLEDLGLKEVPARLASLILLLIEGEGVRTATGYKISTRYTHHQFGTMIGANREAVTRAFARLRDLDAVETRRRYIHVEDMETLRKAAEDVYLQEP